MSACDTVPCCWIDDVAPGGIGTRPAPASRFQAVRYSFSLNYLQQIFWFMMVRIALPVLGKQRSVCDCFFLLDISNQARNMYQPQRPAMTRSSDCYKPDQSCICEFDYEVPRES
jgi:hypothetical protein